MKAGAVVSHSSGFRRSHAQGYRRIVVLDDSSDSSRSEKQNCDVDLSSFLSDDHDVEISAVKKTGNGESETDEEDSDTDSFVVSDDEYFTDDSSFLSRSEADSLCRNIVSPTISRKIQLRRRTKIDLNEGILVPQENQEDSNSDVKHNVGSHEKHEEDYTEISVHYDSDIPSSPIANRNKKNWREEQLDEASGRFGNSEESDDDGFEKYLEKIRNDNSTKKSNRECKGDGPNDSSFIVSDSDVSSVVDSGDESSDGSWIPSDDEISRKQKSLNSIRDSFNSPSVLSRPKKQESDPDEHFLMSLSPDYSGKRHPDAEIYVKRGVKSEKLRLELTSRLFGIFRRQCFKDELPEFLSVKWNGRLCKTAGMCRNMSDRTSWIELSPKVCSTPDRVRDTLVHEMCHAAVWVVDGCRKEGHGPLWKKWASQCMQRFQSLPVIGRCHDYEIDAKFIYECGGCGQKVRRHSKSLNIERMICGICKCRFTLQIRTQTRNKTAGGGASELNPFAMFVKENYGKHKGPGVKHGEVMRVLAQLYKEKNSVKNTVENAEPDEPLDMSVLSIHE